MSANRGPPTPLFSLLADHLRELFHHPPPPSLSLARRFKKNLDNLGSFMRDVRLTVTAFDASEVDGVVQTKWSFRCEHGLPWRPSLSASGGTKHVFNAQNRMVEHVESWDIDPAVALKQLVRPGKRQKKTGGS